MTSEFEMANILHAPLVLVILLNNVEFGESKALVTYARNSSFDDKVCFETDVTFAFSHLDKIHCLAKCTLDIRCQSLFYKTENGQCTGCNSIYSSTDEVFEHVGTAYYALDYSREFGQSCVAGVSCIRANAACWNGTCKCVMGYSFDFKVGKCVDRDDIYGSSFQEYLGYRIRNNNDTTFIPITFDMCRQNCIETNTCLSFEYRLSRSECHISSATSLSHPDQVFPTDLGNLYMRNCAD